MRPFADGAIALLLGAAVFVIHSLSPNATPGDSFWTVPVMLSILSEGNTNLDKYPELLRERHYDRIECVTRDYRATLPDANLGCPLPSHQYFWYPIGTPIVALPFMLGMDTCLRLAGPAIAARAGSRLTPVESAFFHRNYLASSALVEIVLASAIVGLTTGILFLLARLYLGAAWSIVLALSFAFGTSAWSTASRALWQHGPAMLMLTLSLLLLSLAVRRPALLPWAAAPLVFAYFIRPASGLVFAAVSVYVLIHHRPQFLKWLLVSGVMAAPFLARNYSIYHRGLQSYFVQPWFLPPKPENFARIFIALAGQCVSPSRGLFIFSPFLLFSIAGVWLALHRKWMTPLVYYLAAALMLHWFLISDFAYWPAGHCYGPRLFSDVLPLFMFFLIPAFLWLRLQEPRRMLSLVFYVCVLISVFIHYRGAFDWAVYEWNGSPEEVSIARVWNWRDPQFLRGL
jgi:hypothetical protein